MFWGLPRRHSVTAKFVWRTGRRRLGRSESLSRKREPGHEPPELQADLGRYRQPDLEVSARRPRTPPRETRLLEDAERRGDTGEMSHAVFGRLVLFDLHCGVPRAGESLAERSSASRAAAVDRSTIPAISSIDAAVCCRLLAGDSVRDERSWLAAAISLAKEPEFPFRRFTQSRRS